MKIAHIKLAGVLFIIIALAAMMIPIAATADPLTGELIIHKYSMTDVSGATSPGTGNATDENNVPAGAVPLPGVTFKVYAVTIDSGAENGQGLYPDTTDGIRITATDASGNPTQITDSNNKTFSVTSAPGTLSSTGITTGTDGIARTGEIAQGIYLVVEQDSTNLGVTAPSAPFVVALPMTKSDGTGWIDPVNVYPKNEMLTITKTADKPSVSIGDPVAWTIGAAVPSDLSEIKSYTITDQLDSALTFTGIGSVTATTTAGTSITVPSSYYTVSPTTLPAAGALVTVTFDGSNGGIEWLKTNNVRSLKVVINTVVNEGIASKTDSTAENTAHASFTNNNDVTTDLNPSNPSYVHTGTLKITKVDSVTGDAVNGAVFKIARTETEARAGSFLRVDADGNVLTPDAADYKATGTEDITFDTATGNTSSYTGLADLISGSAATYWITETKAPAGYNLLVNPVQVSFSAATKANNWTAEVTVKDSKGFILPLTGAAGVAVFTIVGIVLVGCAVMLTVNVKKKKAEVQASK